MSEESASCNKGAACLFFDSYSEDLARNVVRIELIVDDRRQLLGTGFFIADNIVLTCAHVVSESDSRGIRIFWRSSDFVVSEIRLFKQPDIAVLRTTATGDGGVSLGAEIGINDRVLLYGYTENYQGGLGTVAEFDFSARVEDEGAVFIKFARGQFSPGLSGAPILNLSTNRVCGMANRTKDATSDLGGYAIPLATIQRFVPECVAAASGFDIASIQSRREELRRLSRLVDKAKGDEWIHELVYVAVALVSSAARRRLDIVIEECNKSGFVAFHESDHPSFVKRPLEIKERLIAVCNLAIFDLTDEHPDVVFQLGMHERWGIERFDPDAALLIRHRSSARDFTFIPFSVDEFQGEEDLRYIVRNALSRLGSRPRRR